MSLYHSLQTFIYLTVIIVGMPHRCRCVPCTHRVTDLIFSSLPIVHSAPVEIFANDTSNAVIYDSGWSPNVFDSDSAQANPSRPRGPSSSTCNMGVQSMRSFTDDSSFRFTFHGALRVVLPMSSSLFPVSLPSAELQASRHSLFSPLGQTMHRSASCSTGLRLAAATLSQHRLRAESSGVAPSCRWTTIRSPVHCMRFPDDTTLSFSASCKFLVHDTASC